MRSSVDVGGREIDKGRWVSLQDGRMASGVHYPAGLYDVGDYVIRASQLVHKMFPPVMHGIIIIQLLILQMMQW